MSEPDRRQMLKLAAAAAGAALGGTAAARAAEPAVDTGTVAGGKLDFPTWTAPTERPTPPPPAPLPPSERVGFAVLGLGRLATEEILPAFGRSKRAKLVALISGTPDKARLLARQHGVAPDAVYGYGDWDRIKADPAIQAVYIVTPNALHREATLAAAAAGKHVLCEKPMATSSADCQAMIDACATARRHLMIAYRCQYEPNNRALQDMVRGGRYGAALLYDAVNTQNMAAPTQWRFVKALAGGGALPDIGLYCLNGARFLSGEEPTEVYAHTHSTPGDPRFREVEEQVTFTLRFPSGLVANCAASYGLHENRRLGMGMPAAAIDFANAFAYTGQRLQIAHRDGDAEAVVDRRIAAKDQFALELDHMAECVATGRRPRTPGEEGLADQRIMEAIYRSAATGQPVALPKVEGLDTTRGPALPPADQG
ncbi:Gfo/Idh/MocA family protein [Lichenibacterium dinghuense]|uniref:Gfo/Idh/MocA family protein n=1 Tax=Lichenibacterium dinghuense TaxID=2895977 RepID=UPI001F4811A5|nr:Gfo/Idh/MocA family oxidoreductase [Lichenibacterium sp. 6Y81]